MSLGESTWKVMHLADLARFSPFNSAESVFFEFPKCFFLWKWVVVHWEYHGIRTAPWKALRLDRAIPTVEALNGRSRWQEFKPWPWTIGKNMCLLNMRNIHKSSACKQHVYYCSVEDFLRINLTCSDKMDFLANKRWILFQFLANLIRRVQEIYDEPLDLWDATFSHYG